MIQKGIDSITSRFMKKELGLDELFFAIFPSHFSNVQILFSRCARSKFMYYVNSPHHIHMFKSFYFLKKDKIRKIGCQKNINKNVK